MSYHIAQLSLGERGLPFEQVPVKPVCQVLLIVKPDTVLESWETCDDRKLREDTARDVAREAVLYDLALDVAAIRTLRCPAAPAGAPCVLSRRTWQAIEAEYLRLMGEEV